MNFVFSVNVILDFIPAMIPSFSYNLPPKISVNELPIFDPFIIDSIPEDTTYPSTRTLDSLPIVELISLMKVAAPGYVSTDAAKLASFSFVFCYIFPSWINLINSVIHAIGGSHPSFTKTSIL